MSTDGESRLRFSPTIELGHLLQVIALLGAVGGWGLVGYYQVSKQLDFQAAEMALFKQRLTTDETTIAELRDSMKLTASETRQQLAKIIDQLAEVRVLVAGQPRGGDAPRH